MLALAIYAAALVSGAAAAALEFLGGRMLAPVYGAGPVLRSTLLGITLGSLGIGAYWGGRSPHGAPRPRLLGAVLAGAGTCFLAILWLRRPVLVWTGGLTAHGALAASLLLFALPHLLLGMAGILLLRARTSGAVQVGRSAGEVVAAALMAGALSAAACARWLLPRLGLNQLAAVFGGLLLLAAAAILLGDRPGKAREFLLLLLITVVGGAGISGRFPAPAPPGPSETARLLAIEDGQEAEVRVIEAGDRRYLLVDGVIRAVCEATTFETMLPYVPVMELPRVLFGRADSLLLLGLGAGSLARDFVRKGWRVRALEDDPTIAETARRFFGLAPGDGGIVFAGGREYLRHHRGRYPLILLDLIGSPSASHDLVTREAFGLVASRLAPDGILVVGVSALGWNDPLITILGRSLRTCFREVLALPAAEPPDALGGIVLIASNRSLQIPEGCLGNPIESLADPPAHWAVVQRNHAWDNRFVPDAVAEGARAYAPDTPLIRKLRGGAPWSDEDNGAEVMAEPASLALRRTSGSDPVLGRLCR